MDVILSSLNANEAVAYISEFINVANKTPIQNYSGLMNFDSSVYLNKVASQIGHISQLDFKVVPEPGHVEVRSVPIIGAVSHLSANILDVTQYSSILAENVVDTPALKRAIEDLYCSDGHAVGLDLTLKAYQMNQYAVINQSVARMGGPFFGYASFCLETAKNLYNLGEVNHSIDLLKSLRSDAEKMQEVFADPCIINKYLPVPIPFAKLAAIGLFTGIGLFVTMNVDRFVPVLM